MALTVENGSNTGDSLVTLAEFQAYCTAKGLDLTDYDATTEQTPAIRRASTYISTNFQYQGYKVGGRSQVQAFPRNGMIDDEGYGIDAATIPREAKDATCEAAFYELENPNGLNPSVIMNERVKSETIGPISTTYETSASVSGQRPSLTIIGDLLRVLLSKRVTSNRFTGRANRG